MFYLYLWTGQRCFKSDPITAACENDTHPQKWHDTNTVINSQSPVRGVDDCVLCYTALIHTDARIWGLSDKLRLSVSQLRRLAAGTNYLSSQASNDWSRWWVVLGTEPACVLTVLGMGGSYNQARQTELTHLHIWLTCDVCIRRLRSNCWSTHWSTH